MIFLLLLFRRQAHTVGGTSGYLPCNKKNSYL